MYLWFFGDTHQATSLDLRLRLKAVIEYYDRFPELSAVIYKINEGIALNASER